MLVHVHCRWCEDEALSTELSGEVLCLFVS